MKPNRHTIAWALMLSAFVLSPKSIFAAAGEPVPGAEIYVELEPDDEPICDGKTDRAGHCPLMVHKPGNYSIGVGIPVAFMAERIKKTDHLGTYHFRVEIKLGGKTTSHEFTIPAKALKDNPQKILLSGPFKQSTSKNEDNIIVVVTLEDAAENAASRTPSPTK